MKLTEEQMENAKCVLIDETSDFILERVCDVMYNQCHEYGDELDIEQIDELVCSVFKGLYYEEAQTEQ